MPTSYEPRSDDVPRFIHHGHPFGKEPWRQAHDFVKALAQEGDLVVLHAPYMHLVWDYYDRKKLDRVSLPRKQIRDEELRKRGLGKEEATKALGEALDGRTRIFLVLAHEHTADPDHYFHVLRDILAPRWIASGRFQAAGPILFNRSWGVRVAVFNRR